MLKRQVRCRQALTALRGLNGGHQHRRNICMFYTHTCHEYGGYDIKVARRQQTLPAVSRCFVRSWMNALRNTVNEHRVGPVIYLRALGSTLPLQLARQLHVQVLSRDRWVLPGTAAEPSGAKLRTLMDSQSHNFRYPQR